MASWSTRPAPAKPTSPKSGGTWPGTDPLPLPVTSALCMMSRAGTSMDSISKMSTPELDEHFLRHSFDVARRALTHGNHPFGAVLVDRNRNVLLEAENGYMPNRDGTAH